MYKAVYNLVKKTILLLLLFHSTVIYADEKCTIIYGVYPNYPPFETVDSSGKLSGINIELIKAVAKHINCDLQFKVFDWQSLKSKVSTNEITLAGSSIDFQTFKYAIPLPTMFIQYRIIIGKKGTKQIKDISDLNNMKVAVFEDSIPYAYMQYNKIKSKFVFIDSLDTAIKLILEDKVDVAFIDYYPFEKLKKYKGIQLLSDPIFATPYGFIIGKNNPLTDKIVKAINDMQITGEYYNIIKYSKNIDFHNISKIISILFCSIIFILLIIALWNKMLIYKVKEKTKENKEYSLLIESILQHIPEKIGVIDKHFNVIWDNSDKHNNFDIKTISDYFTDGIAFDDNICRFIITDDQNNTYQVLLLKFSYKDADNFLFIVQDITENIKLRDELFMTTRYSALGEMSEVIAHEINTPIGSIMHNINYLNDYIITVKDKEERKNIENTKEIIDKSIKKVQYIVKELKRYSMDYNKEYTLIDLNICCLNAINITRFLINKCTDVFEYKNMLEKSFIYGNSNQVEQMIINLLQNACYALESRNDFIKLIVQDNNEYIELIVEDSGTGISRDIIKKVCNPYFTTRKSTGGTGLGLSLTSRLIKEHKGSLNIISREKEGTKVILTFPKRIQP